MRLEDWQKEHGFPIWNEARTERRMEGDTAMTTSIWDTYAELYPIPEGMVDSTYGNDACPSYCSEDETVHVWLFDYDAMMDVYRGDDGTRFRVDRSCNGEPAYGMAEGDPMTVTRVQTWADTLMYLTLIVTVKGE